MYHLLSTIIYISRIGYHFPGMSGQIFNALIYGSKTYNKMYTVNFQNLHLEYCRSTYSEKIEEHLVC